MTTGRIPAGRWILVDPTRWTSDVCEITGSDHHHLTRVLRVKDGDWIGLLNGQGGVARARIAEISRQRLLLRIIERTILPAPRPRIYLYQALLRESEMDRIVQASVEIGVARFVAVNTARVVTRWTAAKATARRERWHRIALESVKQSGQPWLTQIEGPVSFADAVNDGAAATLRIFGALSPQAAPMRFVFRHSNMTEPDSVAIYVGPEGDFSEEETAHLRAAGVVPVSFASTTLRAETAAMFATSAVLYEWGHAPASGTR